MLNFLMKFGLLKMAKATIINLAIAELEKKKHSIIKTINEKIDIPGHNEKSEEKIYRMIYDLVLDILRGL